MNKIITIGIISMILLTGLTSTSAFGKQSLASDNNNPPETPSITGSTRGITNDGKPNYFTANVIDPDGDQIQYGFDWDNDGGVADDDWTEFVNSGEDVTKYKYWFTEGTYTVKVKARDEYGAESNWSDPITVTMKKSLLQEIFNAFINGVINIVGLILSPFILLYYLLKLILPGET